MLLCCLVLCCCAAVLACPVLLCCCAVWIVPVVSGSGLWWLSVCCLLYSPREGQGPRQVMYPNFSVLPQTCLSKEREARQIGAPGLHVFQRLVISYEISRRRGREEGRRGGGRGRRRGGERERERERGDFYNIIKNGGYVYKK